MSQKILRKRIVLKIVGTHINTKREITFELGNALGVVGKGKLITCSVAEGSTLMQNARHFTSVILSTERTEDVVQEIIEEEKQAMLTELRKLSEKEKTT